MGRAPQVYQDSGGVAGEIAPLGRTPDVGAMGKKLQKFQNKENGLLPSLTLTRYPLNAYVFPTGYARVPTLKEIESCPFSRVSNHVERGKASHSPCIRTYFSSNSYLFLVFQRVEAPTRVGDVNNCSPALSFLEVYPDRCTLRRILWHIPQPRRRGMPPRDLYPIRHPTVEGRGRNMSFPEDVGAVYSAATTYPSYRAVVRGFDASFA